MYYISSTSTKHIESLRKDKNFKLIFIPLRKRIRFLQIGKFLFGFRIRNIIRKLIEEEKNDNLKLRVFVSGGGCSGFQYGFTFDEILQEGDTSVENGGVTLLVDPMSFQYLMGAEIDYTEGLEGAQFVIRNPNAKTTCGCGSSFSPG